MTIGRVNFAPGSGQMRDPGASHTIKDPVLLTQADHPALAQTAVRKLQVLRTELVELLAKQPAKDFTEYQKRLGMIEGLDIAIAALKEIDARLRA